MNDFNSSPLYIIDNIDNKSKGGEKILKRITAITFLILAFAASSAFALDIFIEDLFGTGNQQQQQQQGQKQYLFVATGNSGGYGPVGGPALTHQKPNKLVITGVSAVVYFSSQPGFDAGHVSLQEFDQLMNKQIGGLFSSNPDAILSILNTGKVKNATVKVNSVSVQQNALIFDVKLVDGKLPKSFGECSLSSKRRRPTPAALWQIDYLQPIK